MAFEVNVRREDSFAVLAVAGHIDMDSSPRLLDAVQEGINGASPLKVDLSAVTYIDSSGIAVLVQGLKHAKKRAVEYRLLNPTGQVKAVIELANLVELFVIETTKAP